MASNTLYLSNPLTNQTRELHVGVSWWFLLFGFLYPLVKGNWKWGLITLGLAMFTWGLSNLALMFVINKLLIKDAISDGFRAVEARVGTLDQAELELGLRLPRVA